jgi:valyl-tRNA synthetase
LSDIEVEYSENKGNLYHIKYPIKGEDNYIVVATTRPETYFGDTAVMVNPEDDRYKHLIGKKVILPLVNREVEIIADSYVDMEFGTGVVKVTPAHDPNDYEVGKRHNLEFIKIFDENGILNEYCGEFQGLERLEARDKIVKKLQDEGFIEKIEEHIHQVGHCYRCKNVVEPYISKQWFVKKEFASDTIKKVNEGAVKFFPSHWINSYNAWMRELRDWCISRQLIWGHQIPVMYCRECSHQWAFEGETPKSCPKCNSTDIYQDPDVLDTWFSSGLWPFSTLGWGNGDWGKGTLWNESDMEEFYPNSLLITGFDILFFWVARMLMMGERLTGKLPFPDVYLHALVKDAEGRKMSKSIGNVIDPLGMVSKYSADALRFTLSILAVQGRDIRLSEEKLELSRNFTNKLYNASNYLLLNRDSFKDLDEIEVKTPLGKYMVNRLNQAIREVRENIEQYRFNDGATTLYKYLWGEFCDWGIELSKASRESIDELGAIFKESMKLLHPFMPFISEYLYQKLSNSELTPDNSIMVKRYPKEIEVDNSLDELFKLAIEAIVSIRRAKTLVDMANKRIDKAYIEFNSSDIDTDLIKPFIEKLAKVAEVEFVNSKPKNAVTDVSDNLKSYISTDDIDLEPIIKKYNNQKSKLEKEIKKLNGMLSNKKFVENAPKAVVEQNQKALSEAKEKMAKIESELNALTERD